MEPQQQQNELTADGGKTGSGFLCRQSSTRWTPTNDQIRILKDLYYNNGVRSPTAEQIQRISARLRQYGKIEGKNVFYWFQNHKARERQKKRFTVDHNSNNIPMQKGHVWRSDYECPIYNKNPNIITTPGVPSASSSSGVAVVGQMGSYGYGSIAMEKSFQEYCSISPVGGCGGGPMGHNFGWAPVDPYHPSPYTFLDQKRMPVEETLVEEDEDEDEEGEEEEEEEEEHNPEIETLPLFPMHGEDISGRFRRPKSNGYYSGWYSPEDITGSSRASLELSLYSYAGRSTDFP